MSEVETKPDRWITTDPVIDNRADCDLEVGLYWVVIAADWEPGEAGSMLYDFPAYRTLFNITGFDEETGIPIGGGYFSDESWDQVQHIWSAKVFEPNLPKDDDGPIDRRELDFILADNSDPDHAEMTEVFGEQGE